MPLALVVFAAVKVAGYAFLATRVCSEFPARVHPVVFGIIRALVGVVAGLGFGHLLGPGHFSLPTWYAALSIVRLGVWAVTLRTLFSAPAMSGARLVKWSLIGTAWSYLLDVPAFVLSLPALATMHMCDGVASGSGSWPA